MSQSLPELSIQHLSQRSMFWPPAYLNRSDWLEHIPFAFWLTEAQRPRVLVELGCRQGVSYFAFCQAVARLGLATRCFGIDTWKGDEHATSHDEQVFEKVRDYNNSQYSTFSRLVRSTFDDARHNFEDGSVDLLHIDGLHTSDAVKRDFDTWLPKLSERAIVVMHHSNVREGNFGVFRLFEQLKGQFPYFEFAHGQGLGILGVGGHQTDALQRLFKAYDVESSRQAIHEVFGRLGRACADALAAAESADRATALTNDVGSKKKQIDSLKQALDVAKGDLGKRSDELAETANHLQLLAAERGQLAERADLLRDLRAELIEEISRLRAGVDVAATELAQKNTEITVLISQQNAQDSELKDSRERARSHEANVQDLQRRLIERAAEDRQREQALTEARIELAQLAERLTQREQTLVDVRAEKERFASQANAQGREIEVACERDRLRDINFEELKQQLAESAAQDQQRERALTEAQAQLAQYAERLAQREQQLIDLQAARERSTSEARAAQEVLESRDALLVERTKELSASVKNNQTTAERADQLNRELEAARREINGYQAKLAQLEAAQSDSNQAMELLTSELAAKTRAMELEQREVHSYRDVATDLKGQVLAQEEEARACSRALESVIEQLEDRVRSLEADNLTLSAALRDRVEEQHAELAVQRQRTEEVSAQLAEKAAEIAKLHASDQVLAAENMSLQEQCQDTEELRQERQMLHNKLQVSFKDVAALTQLLEGQRATTSRLEKELARVEGQLRQFRETWSWRSTKPLRLLARRGKAGARSTRRLSEARELLTESKLFDTQWYLANYPEVAGSAEQAIDHYLTVGEGNGFQPSAEFCPKDYIRANPDVDGAKIGALEHYIRFGRREGRPVR